MDSDQVIKAYIERIMQIQMERRNQLPSKQELKGLVEELGFSDQDFHLIQTEFEEHFQNGQGFQKLENWREAVKEYEKALLINPYDAQTLANIAQAYKKLWDEDYKKKYRQKAKTYARLCLKFRPGYTPALRVIDQISRYEYQQSKNWGLMIAMATSLSFVIYFLIKLFT